jgi:peptidoglycan pentaglycine glycine transferase (the first glycine)
MMMNATRTEWDAFLSRYPQAHFLQSAAWGDLKARFGWRVVRVIEAQGGAQILFRPLPLGYSIAYLPKGPVGDPTGIFPLVDKICQDNKAIFLKVEPDQVESEGRTYVPQLGNSHPSKTIQPRRTVVVSLEGSREEILGRMKQKTRYNIRLAEKKGVVVSASTDVETFHKMSLVTSDRDAFGVHSLAYYQAFYDLFHKEGACELLIAYYDRQPLAAVFVLAKGDRAYYLYGASSDLERNRMPTYLVQWEAMKWAKEKGCTTYDLWGIPDFNENELEEAFLERDSHDGLWGVYRFKRGFGGEIQRSVSAWDRVYHPLLYKLYSLYMASRGGVHD